MTEQEAKEKWCPYVRIEVETGIGAATINRVEDNSPRFTLYKDTRCLASDCMMWRWSTSPEQANQTNARGNAGAIAKGYCGLSGKPIQ